VQIQVSCPKVHPNLKFQEEILLNSKLRNFSEFSFEIHFESREVPMNKVVPFFKPFITIFYFNFLTWGRSFLDRSNFERI
jgi:hypothetical protein